METDFWNQEDEAELDFNTSKLADDIVVFSRDWTVETIISQVSQGNILIDPAFQRRHVWSDTRRSALIESLLIKFPVPQLVIAEHPNKPKSFIVIDGKQRISTLASLAIKEQRGAWDKPKLSGLRIRKDLNGTTIDDFMTNNNHKEDRRLLLNSDVRTTIITNYKDERLLYSIFYRLNTTATPLSSQELRHALSPGPFSVYLSEATTTANPIWTVLGLKDSDARLRDAELLLRLVALRLFASKYTGNLREFLDNTLRALNKSWISSQKETKETINAIFSAIECATEIFGDNIGRKFHDGSYEGRFNRAVFEVQAYSLLSANAQQLARKSAGKLRSGFEKLCGQNPDFLDSVESTTKSVDKFKLRFSLYSKMASKATGATIEVPEL